MKSSLKINIDEYGIPTFAITLRYRMVETTNYLIGNHLYKELHSKQG